MAFANRTTVFLISTAVLCSVIDAFHVVSKSHVVSRHQRMFPALASFRKRTAHAPLSMAAGKGFDKTAKTSSPPKPNKTVVDDTSRVVPAEISPEEPNAGAKALERLRTKQREDKETELRRVKELRSVDEYVRDDPTAAVIPEQVAMRMGKRMLPFVGVPLFGTMAAFVAFWYLRTYRNVEFPTVSVAVVTIGLLVVGLVGITYSVMSASWDTDREGSALGFDEFSNNLDSIKDGLQRSKENVLIREKMAGLPAAEIEAAIKELDEKDKREMKKKASFRDKLES